MELTTEKVFTPTWSNMTFTELMRHNPREAFEYRLRSIGEPIPAEFCTAEELAEREAAIPVSTAPESIPEQTDSIPTIPDLVEEEVPAIEPETPIPVQPPVPEDSEVPGEVPEDTPSFSRDDLKVKLDAVGAKYFKGAGVEVLFQKCRELNLI